MVHSADQELINRLQRYAHPGPPFIKNRLDGRFCITTPIKDANDNKGKAKYVQFILNNSSLRTLLTMGQGHPIFAIKLCAQPHNGAQSPFHPFHQCIFKYRQPYQSLVDRALHSLSDPFIEGEVLQFRHLTQELAEA